MKPNGTVTRPVVSIVIPVFNGSQFVGEAIESALAQTYANIEIIVVNDGSCDNGATAEICRSYDNITYFEKENGGVSTALNFGIQRMKGDYFSWLSHDDVYASDKIEENIKSIEKYPEEIIIPFSNYGYIDGRSELIKKTRVREKNNENAMYSVLMGNINALSVLIDKRCFDKIGLFDENQRTIQDYKLFYELAKNYRFIFNPKCLVYSRIHGQQQGTLKLHEHLQNSDSFFMACLENIDINGFGKGPCSVPEMYYRIAYRHKRNGYIKTEKAALKKVMNSASFTFSLFLRLKYRIKAVFIYLPWKAAKFMFMLIRNL